MTTPMEVNTDVVEICALLQCLGFRVKSLDTLDCNASQDEGVKTVIINCQMSGIQVVLETANPSCSCPVSEQDNSGLWQVSGMTKGRQLDKEFGSTLLGSLPKFHRERLAKDLREMMKCMMELNESDANKSKDREVMINKSNSMIDMKTTPTKFQCQLKPDTPTRYRSLDTLTAVKRAEDPLPVPGVLQKLHNSDTSVDEGKIEGKQMMCRRQSTYTLSSSTPGSARLRNKTSSPIQCTQNSLLENLIQAEKAAEDLRSKLALIIKEVAEEPKDDSSMSVIALDVSKISLLKGAENFKSQFASSPNISGLGSVREEKSKSGLKRFESASTSNLVPDKKPTPKMDEKKSKLRRISPSFFKNRKDSSSSKISTDKAGDGKSSKLTSLFRPRIVTPVRVVKPSVEENPNLSASKRKYSHVRSTIPRPSPTPKRD